MTRHDMTRAPADSYDNDNGIDNNGANGARRQERRQQEPPPPPPARNRQQQPQQQQQQQPFGEGGTSQPTTHAAPPALPLSIETIAAALESGQRQTAPTAINNHDRRAWRKSAEGGDRGETRAGQQTAGELSEFSQGREAGQAVDSRDLDRRGRDEGGRDGEFSQSDRELSAEGRGVDGRDPKAYGEIVGGGGTGGGKKSKGNPNK